MGPMGVTAFISIPSVRLAYPFLFARIPWVPWALPHICLGPKWVLWALVLFSFIYFIHLWPVPSLACVLRLRDPGGLARCRPLSVHRRSLQVLSGLIPIWYPSGLRPILAPIWGPFAEWLDRASEGIARCSSLWWRGADMSFPSCGGIAWLLAGLCSSLSFGYGARDLACRGTRQHRGPRAGLGLACRAYLGLQWAH